MTGELPPVKNKRLRQIEVLADATTVNGWRKQVIAGQPGEKIVFLSGEGWRPHLSPTLTQVSQVAAKRKLTLRNEEVCIVAHFEEADKKIE